MTVAERAISYLQTQPPGTRMPSALLADAIGVDRCTLAPNLARARNRGELVAHLVGDGKLLWALPEGVMA